MNITYELTNFEKTLDKIWDNKKINENYLTLKDLGSLFRIKTKLLSTPFLQDYFKIKSDNKFLKSKNNETKYNNKEFISNLNKKIKVNKTIIFTNIEQIRKFKMASLNTIFFKNNYDIIINYLSSILWGSIETFFYEKIDNNNNRKYFKENSDIYKNSINLTNFLDKFEKNTKEINELSVKDINNLKIFEDEKSNYFYGINFNFEEKNIFLIMSSYSQNGKLSLLINSIKDNFIIKEFFNRSLEILYTFNNSIFKKEKMFFN